MSSDYRLLGRTGVRVSPLCLGTMLFGGKASTADACDMVDFAIDSGVNFIDTANVYVNGESEKTVGAALKRNGHRDFVVLASKCHGNMFKEGSPGTSDLHAKMNPNRWGNSRRQIIEQCEVSLQRLQTDYIDLYQIHRPHIECAIDETLRAFDDLVRSGKVRYIGCSTFAAWQVVESLWTSKELGLNRFISEQPPYHLLDRRIERELIPMAQTFGMAVLPWSPLASGFLTGKYRRGSDAPSDARVTKDSPRSKELMTSAAYDVVERVIEIADEKGCTPSQVALAWNMNQPGITAPIVGPRTMEQLKDNLGAFEVEITKDDEARLDEVSPPGRAVVPYYEASFRPHSYRTVL